MDNKLTKAKEILHHYNQEHLLYFYDELSEEQKELLLNQILGIDFNKILTLYKNSFKSTKLDLNTVSPLPHIEKDRISKEDLDKYTLFDLSMVSKLDYYDGIMLKGYFKNLYKEILSGGRYDGLTESFGRRVPAIGFTIYFDALMEAINR